MQRRVLHRNFMFSVCGTIIFIFFIFHKSHFSSSRLTGVFLTNWAELHNLNYFPFYSCVENLNKMGAWFNLKWKQIVVIVLILILYIAYFGKHDPRLYWWNHFTSSISGQSNVSVWENNVDNFVPLLESFLRKKEKLIASGKRLLFLVFFSTVMQRWFLAVATTTTLSPSPLNSLRSKHFFLVICLTHGEQVLYFRT